SGLDHCRVEGTEALSDFRKTGKQRRVATVKYPMTGANERPARPQSCLLIEESSAGEMAGRGGDDAEIPNRSLLPPIEGKNAFIGDAPVRQMPVDTKRYV